MNSGLTDYTRRCGMCRGSGLFPTQYRDGRKFRTSGGVLVETAYVACLCGEGDRFAQFPRFAQLDMLSPAEMKGDQNADAIVSDVRSRGKYAFAEKLATFGDAVTYGMSPSEMQELDELS